MSEQSTENIPIGTLRAEAGSVELVHSESMKSSMEVLKAELGGQDTSRTHPLHSRRPPCLVPAGRRPLMSMPLACRDVVVNGVRLAYIEREAIKGQDARPVLLLHSLLATAETLTDLIAGLSPDRRIVAISLLSAQSADRAKKLDVHQASLTGLIHDFMKSIGLVQPVLIGHSHGGVLALRLAATDPTALKGLVLMSPAHPFGGYRSRVVNFYLRQPGRMLALSIPLAPSWMILRAFNEAAGSKSRIRMRHLRPHLRVLRNRNTLRRVLEILKTWDEDMDELREVLTKAAIAIPTLLIWGDEDPVVPIASAAELEEHLADSERLTLVGMGHLLAEEAPEECARSIGEWLVRLDARD